MSRTIKLGMMGLFLACMFAGCATAPRGEQAQEDLIIHADGTLERFRAKDWTLADRIAEAHGYAVFPTVGKAGFAFGGAFGRGVVYEMGAVIGFASLTQGSFGAQIGGQAYSELILFDQPAFERLKRGQFTLGAQASAVAVTVGAAANATFQNGVMVFTLGEKGLMVEASVAGQQVSFEPL